MRYTFTLSLILFSLFIKAQTLTYDIYLFGSKIGQSVIGRTVKNDSITQYTLNSFSEAHVFFTHRTVSLHYDITYKRDVYELSYSKHTRNDETHYTTIKLTGNNTYAMKRDDGPLMPINGIVTCSTVKLFFNEPCSPTAIFSERLGEYRTIKKTGDGIYEAEMSDGITYYYHYVNGKLIELEMRKGLLGSVYLRLK